MFNKTILPLFDNLSEHLSVPCDSSAPKEIMLSDNRTKAVYRYFDVEQEPIVNTYTEDFKKRVQSLIDAAIYCIQYDKSLDDVFKQLKKKLEAKYQYYAKEIDEKFKDLKDKQYSKEDIQFLEKKQREFKTYVQDIIVPSILGEMYHVGEGYTSALSRLRKAEIEKQSEQKRPIFLNMITRKYEELKKTEETEKKQQTFFSVQTPMLGYTEEQRRYDSHLVNKEGFTKNSYKRDSEGLSNSVLQSTGYINKDNKLVETLSFTRHASYPPIEIKDEVQRLGITKRNVEQHLQSIANDMITKAKSENKNILELNSKVLPLKVSLSELCLLSPTRKGFSIVDNQQQRLQVLETYLAMNLCQQGPFEITIMEGKTSRKIWVEADIQFMATGVNAVRAKEISSEWRAIIDTRGINQTLDHFFECLQTASQEKEYLINEKNEFHDFFEFYNKETQSQLTKEKEDVEKSWKAVIEHFNSLNSALKNYENITGNKEDFLPVLKKEYDKALKNVKNALREHHNFELKLKNKRKELYQKSQETLYKKADGLEKSNSQMYFLVRDILKMQDLYFNDHHYDAEYNYEFQERWLRVNHFLKRNIAFYCNDGEDRTGRLAITLEAGEIFCRQYNRYPNYKDVKDREIIEQIQSELSQRSTAIENTVANIPGARGLEIAASDGNAYLPFAGAEMARLAKGVYGVSWWAALKRFFVSLLEEFTRKSQPHAHAEMVLISSPKKDKNPILKEQRLGQRSTMILEKYHGEQQRERAEDSWKNAPHFFSTKPPKSDAPRSVSPRPDSPPTLKKG